jgi:hypothetical protein
MVLCCCKVGAKMSELRRRRSGRECMTSSISNNPECVLTAYVLG